MKVQIWMDNGDMVPGCTLKPGTWEGTKLFALTVPADGPRPQLLVAYADATGTVLQSVDLGDAVRQRLAAAGRQACTRTATGTWPQPGSGDTGGVSVELRSSSAKVTVTGSDDRRIDLPEPGAVRAGRFDQHSAATSWSSPARAS